MEYNNDKLIASAFIKARAAIGGTVAKDKKGNFGDYATLAAITSATSAALAANGLAIIQEVTLDEAGVTIFTSLLHESGATMVFEPLTMPLSNRTAQAVGSAATYGRRYALAAVCGLAPDDIEDDGEAAQAAPKGKQSKTVDNPFDEPAQPVASQAQLEALGALGTTFYGKEWAEQLPKLCQAVTKGATSDVSALMPQEADKLINGLKKKMAEVATAKLGKVPA